MTDPVTTLKDFLGRHYSALHGLNQETTTAVKNALNAAIDANQQLADEAKKMQQHLTDDAILAKDYISRVHKQFLDEVLSK